MKKFLLLIAILIGYSGFSQQVTKHNRQVQMAIVPHTANIDSLVAWGSDNMIYHFRYSELLAKLNADIDKAVTINELTDVTITSPTNQQILTYNGSNWINQTFTAGSESDPVFVAWDKDYADLINTPPLITNNNQLTNGAGYITGFTETDPIYTAWDKDYNDLTNKPTIPTNTDNQTLSFVGTDLSITGGNTVDLASLSLGALNDQFTINTTTYTTVLANNHMKGIVNAGDIVLSDTGITPADNYELTLVNDSGGNITVSLGAGQSVIGGQTLPATLTTGQYAYAELIADNVWSVIVGASSGSDLSIYVEKDADVIKKSTNYTTDVTEKGALIKMQGGTTVTLDATGLPVGFNQVVFNDTGAEISLSSANTLEGPNNTIPNGYYATYILTEAGVWSISTPGSASGGAETDPIYSAWNKSTGISITASQVSDFDTEVSNNASVVANTAKVTNATHTGDVTGSGALTIANGAVDLAHLSATGTPSISTYLRGDYTWGTLPGGGDMLKSIYDTDTDNIVDNSEALLGFTDYARYSQANTWAATQTFGTIDVSTILNTGDVNVAVSAGDWSVGADNIYFAAVSTNVTGRLTVTQDPIAADGVGDRGFNDLRYAGISHGHTFDEVGIPDNGTTNNGNVLTAGATSGVFTWEPAAGGDITGVTAGNGLTGGGTSGAVTLNVGAGTGISVAANTVGLANTTVTPGTYNSANITVDAQGRITSAAAGAQGTMSSWDLYLKGSFREAVSNGENVNFISGNGVAMTISTTTNPDITIGLGSLSADWNAGAYNITAGGFYESSMRILKTNIAPFTQSALELISELEIVSFDRIEGAKDKIGVIIEDTPQEFANEDHTAVDIYKTVFIQAKAIQELEAKIKSLEERIKKLEDAN